MKEIKVINSNMEVSVFKPKLIKEYLLKNTDLSDDEAKKIANVVKNQIYEKFDKEITTNIIKSLVLSNLIKRGEIEQAESNTMLGMTVKDFENLLENSDKSNANHFLTSEQITHYAWESIGKQYALHSMPEEVKESYLSGRCHIHDLATYNLKSNCFIYDLRFFLRNGLKIDGNGVNGSVAGPAKSLKVLLNHLQQAFMAGACTLSGGQALNNFDVLVSPLCKGLSYEEIKQEIQGFIYNCNMSLLSRGGQLCFTSIHMDLNIPYYLKDKPAVSFGGNIEGVYGDYQEEFNKVFKAVCEVLKEGDYKGQYHRFPNTVFTFNEISDLDSYEENVKLLHELGVENTFIYYCNSVNDISTSMGCRTRLSNNGTGDFEKDIYNTGNFMYNTINLPMLACESESLEEFYDKLDYECELVYKSLHHRRNEVEKSLFKYHLNDFLLQKDKDTGEPLYDLDRLTYTIGFIGLNETSLILFDEDISVKENECEEIIKYLNNKKEEFNHRDGLRWSVIGSAAENACHTLCKKTLEKYPDCPHNGSGENVYFTNSSHINVADTQGIGVHIKNSDVFHPLTGAGNILHIFLGEVFSNPEALYNLNKKILNQGTIFWSYTKDYSICRDCGFHINTTVEECPVCKSSNIDCYTKITGYMSPVDCFNDGKKQEVKDRVRHNLG